VNEFLAVQVSHGAAELVAVEHQLHVAKATVVAMEKLTQLRSQSIIRRSSIHTRNIATSVINNCRFIASHI